jgi:hypothetical protein
MMARASTRRECGAAYRHGHTGGDVVIAESSRFLTGYWSSMTSQVDPARLNGYASAADSRGRRP